jgi:hypothetical protein
LLRCCGGDWIPFSGCSRVVGAVSIERGGGDLIRKIVCSTRERWEEVDGFGSPLRRCRMRITEPWSDEHGEHPWPTCHKVSGRAAARSIGSQRRFVCYGVSSALRKLVSFYLRRSFGNDGVRWATEGCFASRSPSDLWVIFVGSFLQIVVPSIFWLLLDSGYVRVVLCTSPNE